MLWAQEKSLINLFIKLVSHAEKAERQFIDTFSYHLSKGHDGSFQFGVDYLKQLRKEMSSHVFETKSALYTSRFADLRDDRMVLVLILEAVVEDMTELIHDLSVRDITTPEHLIPLFRNLLEGVSECCEQTFSLTRALIEQKPQDVIIRQSEEVGNAESRCDTLEDHLIEQLYNVKKKEPSLIVLDRVVSQLSRIADRCEDISNHIGTVNLKMVE